MGDCARCKKYKEALEKILGTSIYRYPEAFDLAKAALRSGEGEAK